MKKIMALLSFLGILTSFSYGQNTIPITNLSKLRLKGKIHTITENEFVAGVALSSGEIQKGDIQYKFITYFSKKGDIIEKRIYILNDKWRSKTKYNKFVYKYDDKTNLIEIDQYFSDDNSASLGKLDKYETFAYDSEGKLIEKDFFRSDSSLNCKYLYTYDDKGDMTLSSFISDNKFDHKFIYKYDEKGYMIELSIPNTSGRPESYCKDYAVGNESDDYFLCDGTYSYKYDDNGNQVEEVHYDSKGDMILKFTYKYDSNGNEVESEITSGLKGHGGANYSYKYRYDKTGNWIERINYGNNFPKKISDRVIEYYK